MVGETKYWIKAQTLDGKVINFNVDEYSIVEGDFVEFIDPKSKNKAKKRFHASRCEIDDKRGSA